jgi:serine/threonine protein kinase
MVCFVRIMSQEGDVSALRIGDSVGAYRLVREIGRGAMAVVFEASGPGGRNVAVKVLLPEIEEHAEIVDRFEREGRILQALRHENIARAFDVGALPNGTIYLVVELLEGEDLRTMLETSGPLPIATAVRYVLGACRGVAEAHSEGIVHRDLKPANLFLARDQRGGRVVKVLDFGVAKIVGGVESQTGVRELLGSAHYAAPEQLVSSKDVGPQSDVWALGVVLYKMLTDTHPFDGTSIALLCAAIQNHTPRPLRATRPDCPAGLEDVIRRCLSKEPEARFATAGELANALEPFAGEVAPMRVPAVSTSDEDAEAGDDEKTILEEGTRLMPSGRELQKRSAMASLEAGKKPREGAPATRRRKSSARTDALRLRRPSVLIAVLAVLLLGGVAVGWKLGVLGSGGGETVKLHVLTQPAGASFSLDYGEQRTTPGDVSLSKDERSHVLMVWKDGYRPESRQVTAVADATVEIPLVSASP